jgi:hypothetical protein
MANYIGVNGLVFSQDDETAVISIEILPEAASPIVISTSTTQSLAIWLRNAATQQTDEGLNRRMRPLYDRFGKATLQAWLTAQNGG